ncbi:LacI family transcriptional regulator [Treponema sp. OttesenSCG-928-L16]|nr:LacI family transcriptional regulator [Treponema sp. OttesenSCG-928-L16]
MSVTILDIAREAGVSKSTVSLVINNSEKVRTDTHFKVRQAIEKLGYVPNQAARQLIMKRTHTLGLIFFTYNHLDKAYAFSSVPETLLSNASSVINLELFNSDYTLLTERFSLQRDSGSLPRIIKERRLDGVFLIGGILTDEFMKHIQELKLPSVIIGTQYEGLDSVSTDYEESGFMGLRYLIEHGKRKILFVNGPKDSTTSQLKLRGVNRGLKFFHGKGISLTAINSEHTGQAAYQCMKKYWEREEKPDAVFCGNNGISSGVIRFLYQLKLHIPEDVSVLTLEDSILTEYCTPPLTSIDTQSDLLGKEACRMLLSRIKKPRSKTMALLLPPVLTERGSVLDADRMF